MKTKLKQILTALAILVLSGCSTVGGIPLYSDKDTDWLDLLGRSFAHGLHESAQYERYQRRQVVCYKLDQNTVQCIER